MKSFFCASKKRAVEPKGLSNLSSFHSHNSNGRRMSKAREKRQWLCKNSFSFSLSLSLTHTPKHRWAKQAAKTSPDSDLWATKLELCCLCIRSVWLQQVKLNLGKLIPIWEKKKTGHVSAEANWENVLWLKENI